VEEPAAAGSKGSTSRVLATLRDLTRDSQEAAPDLLRSVYAAFRLTAILDRDAHEIRVKALSRAPSPKTHDLEHLVAKKGHSGGRI
jgi:hypothetical protein